VNDLATLIENCETYNRWTRFPAKNVKRIQRHPQYSDEEMMPFFEEISKGYCYKQSADHCLYPREWVLNTLYSDDDVIGHMLELSMVAGALIRAGEQEPPLDRYDKLYNKYSKTNTQD